MENGNVFKDRQSDNPNRRELTIIEQYGDKMIVDIARADTNVKEPGTPLNAFVLNAWDSKVLNALEMAVQSESKSTEALGKANNAEEKANDAEKNSSIAKRDAASALAQVNALVDSVDFSEVDGDGVPSVTFIDNADGTKKLSFKNLKGGRGDNVHVRYSFDKTSMTEQPATNTAYIGFYYGEFASNNVNDYAWTQIWGAKAISAAQYSQMLLDGTVNPEEVYFIEGSTDGSIVLTSNNVQYSNENSGLKSTTIQDAIDEINQKIPDGLSELSERSYDSLTNKPFIPTALYQLSDRSYDYLTDKPTIPTSLLELSERSYNSLTDKPPIVDKAFIASVLGISTQCIDNLVEFARRLEFDGDGFKLNANHIDVNN